MPQARLDDLARRLERARWPQEQGGDGWDLGVVPGYLRRLADRWRSGFDWRAHESRLNALPQSTTVIDGQLVHFVHVRSSQPAAVPLLLTHGWPGTFADFAGVVAPLAEPAAHGSAGAPAFDVVVPSLPGFGFSGPPRERGWGVTRIARAWAELMRRLGHDRYLVQGGDLGSLVSPEIARVAPEHVLGVHLNAVLNGDGVEWGSPGATAGLSEDEVARARAAHARWQLRGGYAALQSTRPQTLAYALVDSPLGLLAWMADLEWFADDGSGDHDPARDGQAPVEADVILTAATIYWVTGTAGSAARLYQEVGSFFAPVPRNERPTAVAVFPGDGTLRALAERYHHLVRYTEHDRGGHFASLQAPDLFVQDVRAFTGDLVRSGA